VSVACQCVGIGDSDSGRQIDTDSVVQVGGRRDQPVEIFEEFAAGGRVVTRCEFRETGEKLVSNRGDPIAPRP